MKKKELTMTHKTLIGVGIFALLLVLWITMSYNGLVTADETVSEKWANVQTAYQRRADLIPNLVETVKQYSNYEGDLLRDVTEARASVGRASTPGQLAAAGTQMNSAISRLLLVAENYPNLKANENYLSLQDELAGTENRIKTERDVYNKAIKQLNVKVRRFPTNVIAGMFGFEKKESFEADVGTDTVPKVDDLFS